MKKNFLNISNTSTVSCLMLILLASFMSCLIGVMHPVGALEDDKIVVRVDGSIEKVSQLVGDFDIERNESTLSLTYTRYGVAGTDLGVSFEHDGKLIFLFGDTVGRNAFPFSGKDDSFAYTFDEIPSDGLNLIFYTGAPSKFLPPIVPGVYQSSFEVPMEGIDINGTAYVYFTTNHTEEKTMGSSILARLNETTMEFTFLYTLSNEKFINVHVAVINNSEITNLPETSGQGILIWGSGKYRESDPYLAYMPLKSIENKSTIRYFAGLDFEGDPVWSVNEFDTQPLFIDSVIGEFSVAWNPYLERWIMLYDGVSLRSSLLPWGTWSSKQVLFNPFSDGGYGHFIHWPNHDNVSDPLRQSEWGGPYGPYLIDKYTSSDNGTSTIYFTLSTWNPYTTVLMRANLQLKSIDGVPELSDLFLMIELLIVPVLSIAFVKALKQKLKRNKVNFRS